MEQRTSWAVTSLIFRIERGVREFLQSSHMYRRNIGHDGKTRLLTMGSHTLKANSHDKKIWVDVSEWLPQKGHNNSGMMWRPCNMKPVGNLSRMDSQVVILTLSDVATFQICFIAISCEREGCNNWYWKRTVKLAEDPAFQIILSIVSWKMCSRRVHIRAVSILSLTTERWCRNVIAQLLSWTWELTHVSLSDATSKRLEKTCASRTSPIQQSFQNFTEDPCPHLNLSPSLIALNVLRTPCQSGDTLLGSLSCSSKGLRRR